MGAGPGRASRLTASWVHSFIWVAQIRRSILYSATLKTRPDESGRRSGHASMPWRYEENLNKYNPLLSDSLHPDVSATAVCANVYGKCNSQGNLQSFLDFADGVTMAPVQTV